MPRFLIITLSCVFLMAACGKGDDAKKNENAAVAKAPPFDCAHFEKRAKECSKELIATYITTDFGAKVNGKTPEAKTKNLNLVFGMIEKVDKQNLCENMPAWGNLKQKDPRWQKRFNDCKKDAPCAEWGKCIGGALGNKL